MIARAIQHLFSTTSLRQICVAMLLLAAAAGCDDETLPLPYIVVNNLPPYAVLTTNNGLNPAITLRGAVINVPPSRGASVQIVNALGAFPMAAPALPVPLSSAGVFSVQLQAPLINSQTPFMAGPGGNAIIFRASNQFSPLDTSGNTIPTVASFSLYIDNQIVFTNPVYATLDDSEPPEVVTDCDLTTPMNVFSGTFSVPDGTLDAADVITSAELVQRNEDQLYGPPLQAISNFVEILAAADGETYSVTINGMLYEITTLDPTMDMDNTIATVATILVAALNADANVRAVKLAGGRFAVYRADNADFTISVDAQTPANIMLGAEEGRANITVEEDGTFEHTLGAMGGCTSGTPEDCNFFVRFTSSSPAARALLGSYDTEVVMATHPFTGCAVD